MFSSVSVPPKEVLNGLVCNGRHREWTFILVWCVCALSSRHVARVSLSGRAELLHFYQIDSYKLSVFRSSTCIPSYLQWFIIKKCCRKNSEDHQKSLTNCPMVIVELFRGRDPFHAGVSIEVLHWFYLVSLQIIKYYHQSSVNTILWLRWLIIVNYCRFLTFIDYQFILLLPSTMIYSENIINDHWWVNGCVISISCTIIMAQPDLSKSSKMSKEWLCK